MLSSSVQNSEGGGDGDSVCKRKALSSRGRGTRDDTNEIYSHNRNFFFYNLVYIITGPECSGTAFSNLLTDNMYVPGHGR
jgi:hypothetical protein